MFLERLWLEPLLTWVRRVHQQLSHKGWFSKGRCIWGGGFWVAWLTCSLPRNSSYSFNMFWCVDFGGREVPMTRCCISFLEHTHTMVLTRSFVQLKMAILGLGICVKKKHAWIHPYHKSFCTSSEELLLVGDFSIYDFNQYAILTITTFSKAWGPRSSAPIRRTRMGCWCTCKFFLTRWFLPMLSGSLIFNFFLITSLILCAWKFSKTKESQFWVFF